MSTPKYSVIIPCFNEQEILSKSYEKLTETMNKSKETYELIFINDGSRDSTYNILKEFAIKDKNVKIINFSRNFGQQKAINAGLKYCLGDAAIIIDADLQDPPYVILEMIKKWKEGFDMVYGQRDSREGETFFKKITSKLFYRVLNALSDVKIPLDTGDFRLIDRKLIDKFNEMPEEKKYIRAYFSWLGYSSTSVNFKREAREAGETKYNLKAMLKLAFDGIYTFSNKPFKLPLFIGITTFILALILALKNIILFNIPGLRFSFIVFLFALHFIVTASNNKYLEIMNDNIKNRPQYIVKETINMNNKRD